MWLTTLIVASLLYVIWIYIYPKSASVPLHPGHLPVLGYALNILRLNDVWKFMQDAGTFSLENGGITKLWVPCVTFYNITDANAAATVLSQCLDKMFFYKAVEPVFGSVLVAAPVPKWKVTRRILDIAFKQNVLNGYLDLFNHQAAKLADVIENEVGTGEVNLKEVIGSITLETSWQTTVEKTEDGNVDTKIIECLEKQSKLWIARCKTFYLLPNFIFYFSKLKKEQEKYMKIIDRNIKTAIEKSKAKFYERRKCNNDKLYEDTKFFSNLDIILENSITDHGFLYSDSDLKLYITNLLLATFETTNSALLYILICIGSDSGVQDKVYEEIQAVVGDNDVTKDHLPKLVYLGAVIKEVIRLFPAGPVVARQSDKEVYLKNVTIPKGGCFVIHLWAINRRKEYWGEDADIFRPERWLNPETLPSPATAFSSFSLGQRNCIGKNYAMDVFKVYLVHILRRYRVSGDYRKMKFEFDPLLKSVDGDLVTLNYR